LLALTMTAAPASAQRDPVTGAVNDIGLMVTSPARLEKTDIYPLAGVIGTGLILYTLDSNIRGLAQRNKTKTLDNISDQVQNLGNGGYDIAITGAGYLAGLAFSDEKLRDTSLLAAESFLAANGVGTVVKYAVGRSRPYAGAGKDSFHPFTFKSSRTSFPSGHTTSAFSVASVYAYNYSDSFWTGAAAYGLAGLVALQRVYADKHWASDAFLGAALGTATGRMIAANAAKKGKAAKTAAVFPVLSAGYSGAELAMRF
jgi:hypothetical protein